MGGSYDPGSGSGAFEFMVNQTIAARTAALALWQGASITIKIIYLQGKADAVNAVAGATYLTALNLFISAARSRITGASGAQVVVVSIPLTASDSHATFHLDGGAEIANFEISDRY